MKKSNKRHYKDDQLDALYRQHFDELCLSIRRSFGTGPPDPEDAVQTAFARFAGLKNQDKVRNARSFLYIMARNIVLDFRRSRKVSDAYIDEQIALDRDSKLEGITPERVVIHKQRFETLIEAMRTLPHKQQKILYMSRIEGKSYREIGQETGWSAGDISRNMNAGISALAAALERRKARQDSQQSKIDDGRDNR
ncbi:MAG: sigma-70 family RNA polymerase sigma factor [Pseudomonadota bacterium]